MILENWKKYLIENKYSKKDIQALLDKTLKKIEFLENIYQTGGKFSGFSESFRSAAVRERDELCQCSSACYSLLRNV